jgi:hypothetical protein
VNQWKKNHHLFAINASKQFRPPYMNLLNNWESLNFGRPSQAVKIGTLTSATSTGRHA